MSRISRPPVINPTRQDREIINVDTSVSNERTFVGTHSTEPRFRLFYFDARCRGTVSEPTVLFSKIWKRQQKWIFETANWQFANKLSKKGRTISYKATKTFFYTCSTLNRWAPTIYPEYRWSWIWGHSSTIIVLACTERWDAFQNVARFGFQWSTARTVHGYCPISRHRVR